MAPFPKRVLWKYDITFTWKNEKNKLEYSSLCTKGIINKAAVLLSKPFLWKHIIII